MLKYISSFLLLLFPFNILSAQETIEFEPLYAGTQLSLYPLNTDVGRFSVQPFIFLTRSYGIYKPNWSVDHRTSSYRNTLLLSLETGITSFLDINLIISEGYHTYKHKHAWRYGDTLFYFGLQLLKNKKDSWTPDLRFLIGEVFPTGKYQRLNLHQLPIDSTGLGSYQTSLALVIRKIFYTYPHPFSVTVNLIDNLCAVTKVCGFNAYGGGPGTHGKAQPGNIFITNLGLELSLTRNWELGLDIRYEHQNKSPFKGKSLIPTGLPSSERFSLAPCIEYCFSEDFTVAAGSWFSVAGRNNAAFISWVANVFYLF